MIDAELRARLIEVGLKQWLDAWEGAGLPDGIPQGLRSLQAYSEANQNKDIIPNPKAWDRVICGLQNAVAETMYRKIATAWVNAALPGETPGFTASDLWVPADKAIFNNIGVRVFHKTPSARERWTFKNSVLVQIPTADQATWGTFANRVDIRWTSESTNTGNVAWNVRLVHVDSTGLIDTDFGTPEAEVVAYTGNKKVYETRFEFDAFDVGDIVVAQIDREYDNEVDDTLEASVGLIDARVV